MTQVPDTTTTEPPRPVTSTGPLALPERDVRRKRPPWLSFVLRMETARRLLRVASLLLLDFAGVYLAVATALGLKALLRGALDLDLVVDQTKDYAPFAFLVTALLFARSNLYGERAARPGLSAIISSLFQVTLIALIFTLASGDRFSSYYIFYGSLFFGIVWVATLRWGYEGLSGVLLRAAGYRRRALIVGSGAHIDDVAHALSETAHAPVDMLGFISLKPRPSNGLPSLGTIGDLPRVLDRERVQEVIIADPDFPQEAAVELVDQCHQRGVTVRIAPSTMEILVHRAEFVPGSAMPLFELRPPVFEGLDYVVKRTFDLVGASLILLVLSPLLALIALAVKMTTPGPVLYRSMRPGIGGRPFACLKFRTMRSDADELQADLEQHNEATGPLFKIKDDPRVTAVGRLLRRFSLDEMPQLLNVVGGEMSLVGPRPLPQRDFDQLEDWHKKRYLVLPGITGLWQVSGRAELDFDDLVRLDFLYLERWSVFLDLVILLKTAPAVFTRRGAY
jgi:exopolysaccharide biosynthesis polyprenyl glycosylphosphotransferase